METSAHRLLAERVNEGSLDSRITLLLRRRSTKPPPVTHIPVLWPIHFEICLVREAYRNLHNPFSSQLKIPLNNKIACSLVCFMLLWEKRGEGNAAERYWRLQKAGMHFGLCLRRAKNLITSFNLYRFTGSCETGLQNVLLCDWSTFWDFSDSDLMCQMWTFWKKLNAVMNSIKMSFK